MTNIYHISMLLLGLIVADHEDAILGVWHTPKHDGKIEIYKSGDRYYGKLIAYSIPDAKDIYNDDPKLRDRPVVGLVIFKDFVYDESKNKWIDGSIYDPESGNTYGGALWEDEDNPEQLKARGHVIGMSFLGRTETFARAH